MFAKWELLIFFGAIVVGLTLPAVLSKFVGTFFLSIIASSSLLVILVAMLTFMVSANQGVKDIVQRIRVSIVMASLSTVLTFAFLATVPLTLDRSFSVWMISTQIPSSASQTVTQSDLELGFEKFFSTDSDEIDRRIVEQLSIGNIVEEDEGLRLSKQGDFLVRIFQSLASFYGLNELYTFGDSVP